MHFSIKRHYGILLLYGQHLALNHLVGINQIQLIIGHELLDLSTTDDTTAYIQQGPRLNLHCRHVTDAFSKFRFKEGRYNETDLEKYRNDTTALAYVRTKIYREYVFKAFFLIYLRRCEWLWNPNI